MRASLHVRNGTGTIALLIALAFIASASSRAQQSSEVTLNVFPGGFNWPTFVAQEKGFFTNNGIRVTLQATPNSVAQMTGLAEGKFDIAITAVDNVVAYVEGQGQAPIGPQPEFFAFMGSDSGFLSLVATPEIKSFSDLRGRTLSVDARSTGYAFVLFEMLVRNGLSPEDYRIEEAGGMTQRWNALRERKQSATLLSAPFNILAKEQYFNALAHARQSYGELLDPKDGFLRHALMNLEGLRTVLALRSRYAEPQKKLADPMRYYDPSYYNAAMRPR